MNLLFDAGRRRAEFGHCQNRLRTPANVRNGRVAAGEEIKKRPFDQLSRPMSGNHPTVVIAWPDDERPLWPSSVNWASGSFRSAAVVRMTATKGWQLAAVGRLHAVGVMPESGHWNQ
ncbi:MAG: hypothetical protein WBM97_03350 [Sedimenticolaceae bacterium]